MNDTQAAATTQTDANAQDSKDMLRFITCGSVDDGKSTLIGRLLWDSNLLHVDQRASLERESQAIGRAGEGAIDFSLLVDGLSAEREQGITIDVAYRFFQTEKRKFIVADTPGHEQYTRNMATGASTAELAIILVDARAGILAQTRRHATIVHLMGIQHVILAVNKMDIVGWDEARFNDIEQDFVRMANGLGITHTECLPLSALTGDNIRTKSEAMPWYTGPTLMDFLETVQIDAVKDTAFRFPVQWVNRPNLDFRGFSGTVAGGAIQTGDKIIALPSYKEAVVARIVTQDGDLPMARAGDAVTITLDREIDVSRGDVLVAANDKTMSVADQLQAHLVWVAEDRLLPGRPYQLRLGTATTNAKITGIKYKFDIQNQAHVSAKSLALNDVGVATLSLDSALPFDSYATNRSTGSFILVDRHSNATVAAGMIDYALRRATNVVWHNTEVNKEVRANLKGQQPACLWFTGLSGSGKSTVANMVDKRLTSEDRHTYILDGDNVRYGLNRDLGFTEADRIENIRRIAEVAKLMVDAGLIVLVCAISPYRRDREIARELFDDGEFVEIFVDTPLEECEARDPKGLYKKARDGQIPNFTGISAPYERPEAPEVHLSGTKPVDILVDEIFRNCDW